MAQDKDNRTDIRALHERQERERWDTLLNCLFGGGGEDQAIEMILNLIRLRYIKAEILLLKIGRELDYKIDGR